MIIFTIVLLSLVCGLLLWCCRGLDSDFEDSEDEGLGEEERKDGEKDEDEDAEDAEEDAIGDKAEVKEEEVTAASNETTTVRFSTVRPMHVCYELFSVTDKKARDPNERLSAVVVMNNFCLSQ